MVQVGGKSVREDSNAFTLTMSSLTMEIVAVTRGNGLTGISNFLQSMPSQQLSEHAHGRKGLGSKAVTGVDEVVKAD